MDSVCERTDRGGHEREAGAVLGTPPSRHQAARDTARRGTDARREVLLMPGDREF